MPLDGSGHYTRVTNWVNDRDAGIKIEASRHDAGDDDVAAALSTMIARDGQSQITADIPFNGKKITGLADPTNPQDAATKAFAEGIRTFNTAMTVSGAAANARIKFTGTTGPWGFEFQTVDLSFGVRAGIANTAWERFVWNEKLDLSGQDIMTLVAGPAAQLGVGEAPPVAGATGMYAYNFYAQGSLVLNAYLNAASTAWLFRNPGFAFLITSDRANGTFTIYRSHAAGVADGTVTWQERMSFDASGQVIFPSRVFATANTYLDTNGNVVGTVWATWGANDAYSAIHNRIETRCEAFRDTVPNGAGRSAGYIGYAGSGGAGAYFENNGYYMTSVQKVSGDSYNIYFRMPQVNVPNLGGWVMAFSWA